MNDPSYVRFVYSHAESNRCTDHLNTYEVTVEAGNDLDKTSYIKEITDDADSQESLFNQIEIDGDVDTAVPGDYTLTYHVTDSDGNRSNAAVLTVHVQ